MFSKAIRPCCLKIGETPKRPVSARLSAQTDIGFNVQPSKTMEYVQEKVTQDVIGAIDKNTIDCLRDIIQSIKESCDRSRALYCTPSIEQKPRYGIHRNSRSTKTERELSKTQGKKELQKVAARKTNTQETQTIHVQQSISKDKKPTAGKDTKPVTSKTIVEPIKKNTQSTTSKNIAKPTTSKNTQATTSKTVAEPTILKNTQTSTSNSTDQPSTSKNTQPASFKPIALPSAAKNTQASSKNIAEPSTSTNIQSTISKNKLESKVSKCDAQTTVPVSNTKPTSAKVSVEPSPAKVPVQKAARRPRKLSVPVEAQKVKVERCTCRRKAATPSFSYLPVEVRNRFANNRQPRPDVIDYRKSRMLLRRFAPKFFVRPKKNTCKYKPASGRKGILEWRVSEPTPRFEDFITSNKRNGLDPEDLCPQNFELGEEKKPFAIDKLIEYYGKCADEAYKNGGYSLQNEEYRLNLERKRILMAIKNELLKIQSFALGVKHYKDAVALHTVRHGVPLLAETQPNPHEPPSTAQKEKEKKKVGRRVSIFEIKNNDISLKLSLEGEEE